MTFTRRTGLGLLLLALAGSTTVALQRSAAAPRPPAAGTPVVVELFTSQGCHGCPPAEEVLTALGDAYAERGTLVPLAYHVDYWNRLGWTDPFSDARWSHRQERYAAAFEARQLYTPQLVVNGRGQLPGNQGPQVAAAILAAHQQPPAGRVQVDFAPPAAGATALVVDLAAALDRPVEAREVVLMVAVFENGLRMYVPAGENAGRTLANDYVVRRLDRAVTLAPVAGARDRGTTTIPVDPAWDLTNIGVAAFLQDLDSMRIYAGAVAHPAGPAAAGGGTS